MKLTTTTQFSVDGVMLAIRLSSDALRSSAIALNAPPRSSGRAVDGRWLDGARHE
jgi:hypothetical protein